MTQKTETFQVVNGTTSLFRPQHRYRDGFGGRWTHKILTSGNGQVKEKAGLNGYLDGSPTVRKFIGQMDEGRADLGN